MNVSKTAITSVLLIQPKVFVDARGSFLETYKKSAYEQAGIIGEFVQDNLVRSQGRTLRGLHYQLPRPQGKLVWVNRGAIFDVAVDLRQTSATFGQWVGFELSEENHLQLYVPPGFAHGYCVLSDVADVNYKCTDSWCSEFEHTLAWNDPQLSIPWPINDPILSEKDRRGQSMSKSPYFDSVDYQ